MTKPKLSLLLSIILFILFCSAAWSAHTFPETAMYFPFYLSVFGILLTLTNIFVEYRNLGAVEESGGEEEVIGFDTPVTHDFKAASLHFLWFLGYFALIFTLGFMIATAIYLVSFLKAKTNFNWLTIVLSTAFTIGFMVVLEKTLNLQIPQGLF